MRFSDHRRQYTLGGLRRADLAEDPVAQFVAWQDQAIAAGLRIQRPAYWLPWNPIRPCVSVWC